MDFTRSKGTLASLFMVGLFASCFDLFAIPVGGVQLKVAYLVFPLYVVLFVFSSGLRVDASKLAAGGLFLLFLLPGVIFSTAPMTSIAFFMGAIVSVSVMFTFSRLVALSGDLAIKWMVAFYRFSIVVTAILFFSRIQVRGHFVLYESSYYAIFLIPYFCIIFNRLFFDAKKPRLDLALVLLAIVATESASMVLYVLAIVLYFMIVSKVMTWRSLVGIGVIVACLVAGILMFSLRGQAVIAGARAAMENPEAIWPLLFVVGGDRFQRVMIALQTFSLFPTRGVGLGALKQFSASFFVATDFSLNGASAWDFSTDTNATNVFLEIAAEGGVPALVGYCCLLVWIFLKNRARAPQCARQMELAFLVTTAALLLESSYLRTYVWALYGVLLGLRDMNASGSDRE